MYTFVNYYKMNIQVKYQEPRRFLPLANPLFLLFVLTNWAFLTSNTQISLAALDFINGLILCICVLCVCCVCVCPLTIVQHCVCGGHLNCWGEPQFVLFLYSVLLHCMHALHFIYRSVVLWTFGLFPGLALMQNAAKCIYVHISGPYLWL